MAGARRKADSALPVTQVRAALLGWFAQSRRPMPWRQTTDPYAIWVSEVMLQQTQVATVIPYYQRFLAELPTVEALAEAPPERVLRLWEGLGYYRRARHLQAAAQAIVARHHGRFPASLPEALALPGVGAYTAGAVLSIAYGLPVPCVDGNVERVLSRALLLETDPRRAPARDAIRQAATTLVDCSTPGDVNQALMELGATVCTPRNPVCASCPVAAWCAARASGRQDDLPASAARPKTQRAVTACAAVWRGSRVLVAQRAEGGVWGGLWELPQVEVHTGRPQEALRAHLASALGLEAEIGERLGEVRHTVMAQAISLQVHEARVRRGRVRVEGYAQARWMAPSALGELPMSAAHRRAVGLIGPGQV